MELVYENRASMVAQRLDFGPSWISHIEYSPDGTSLIFEGLSENSNRDIYLMTANGENLTRLTVDPGVDFDPAWKPVP